MRNGTISNSCWLSIGSYLCIQFSHILYHSIDLALRCMHVQMTPKLKIVSSDSNGHPISSDSDSDVSPYENPKSSMSCECFRSSSKPVTLTYPRSKSMKGSKKRKGDARHDVFYPSPTLKSRQPESKEQGKHSIRRWVTVGAVFRSLET